MIRALPLAALVLAAAAAGQCNSFHVPDDTPGVGRCSWVPFGRDVGDPLFGNQRYQTVVTAADLASTPAMLGALGFAACGLTGGAATGSYSFDSIKITLDHLPGGVLSTTFDDNLTPAAVVVLDRPSFTWPVTENTWSDLPFDVDFAYQPCLGDLVVEIIVTGAGRTAPTVGEGMRRHGARQRVFAYGYTGAPPAVALFDDSYALKVRVCARPTPLPQPFNAIAIGTGCPAAAPLMLSYSGSTMRGANLGIDVSNGPSTGAGVAFVEVAGTFSPGFDLTALGYPGCTLYLFNAIGLPLTFTGGFASTSLPLPAGRRNGCQWILNQAIAIDPGIPGGASVSNLGRAVIER